MRIEIAEIENRNVIGDDPAVYSDHDEGTLPHQPPTEKSDVIGPRGRKSGLLSETSDDYSRVVAVLDRGRSRVIVCAAGIQWIVQNRRGQQWHSRSFSATASSRPPTCRRRRSDPGHRRNQRPAAQISPEFITWRAIMKRGCRRRWRCYPNFRKDVGLKPSWRHLLIRADTSREFGPGNVGWRVARWYRRRRGRAGRDAEGHDPDQDGRSTAAQGIEEG